MSFGGRGRGGLSTLSAVCALVVPSVALAQADLRVNVEIRNCAELPQPEVRRVLAAELSARLAEDRSPDVTRIVIECQGPRAVLRVGDPLSRKVVQRSIDLGSSAPQARGRLVALATAELVVASWSELESNPTPKVEPAGPRPPPQVAAAARRVISKRAPPKPRPPPPPAPARTELIPVAEQPPREPAPKRRDEPPYDERWPDPHAWGLDDPSEDPRLRVVAMASLRSFFTHEGALWGGGLRAGQERFNTVGWTLDALAETGEIKTELARFRVNTATLGAGIHLYGRSNWFVVRVGAGIRLGLARTQAVDPRAAPNSALAPWGWPLGSLGFSVRGKRGPMLEISTEAGYVVLPVAVAAPPVKGPWFGLQGGFGVFL